ncbi:Transposable element Tcb2 transposase [Araneus ventricosus]|uniref:Transposable element Tcb2 transposase n=1 Tax=Araneus ventricosus TaxID=182803 RepID=A0A4Y2BPN2_ARAVE|nr:Transposable element Tcb2 transposase [Araneus ventricosus]
MSVNMILQNWNKRDEINLVVAISTRIADLCPISRPNRLWEDRTKEKKHYCASLYIDEGLYYRRRRRSTTVPQLVADHFVVSGRRISATTVRRRLHNASLYARRPVVCVSLNGRQRRARLCRTREHVSWTRQQWASVLFTDESRFTLESDSECLLIWREQRTRYHQSNTLDRHSYRDGGIMVWAAISLGGHTDLHVFHGGTLISVRYRNEILDPYVRPYAGVIGNDFILLDDNARPHRALVVEDYLEGHGLERMEWPAQLQTRIR